jgi:hypothetical protein
MKTLTPTKHLLLAFFAFILSTCAVLAQSLPSKVITLTNTLTETGLKPTPCEASFTYDVYSNGSAFFASTSTGDSFNCIWRFGDGPLGAFGPNQSHTYAAPGTYHVFLLINNNSGCFDTVTTDIYVPGSSGCNATFTYTEDSPYTYTFTPNWLEPGTNYHWTFDYGDTSTDTVPTHTFNQSMFHYICLAVSNDLDSCWSEVCDTIVINNNPTGLKEANSITIYNAYPVPFTNELRFDLVAPGTTQARIVIMDITGKTILEKEIILHQETNTIVFNTTDLPDGMYFADIQSGYRHIVKKIFK